MNIHAEDIEKARAFLPGLFKFDEEGLFKQALLALSEDTLFIYNDNAPDTTFDEDWNYSVKLRIPLEDVKQVTNELIYKHPDLEGLNRLAIAVVGEDPLYFYYYADDKKSSNNFLAGLKYYGVEVSDRRVELIS